MSTIIADTPESIDLFMLIAARSRLRMEIAGIRFKGPALLKQIKARAVRIGDKPPRTREDALIWVQDQIDALRELGVEFKTA